MLEVIFIFQATFLKFCDLLEEWKFATNAKFQHNISETMPARQKNPETWGVNTTIACSYTEPAVDGFLVTVFISPVWDMFISSCNDCKVLKEVIVNVYQGIFCLPNTRINIYSVI